MQARIAFANDLIVKIFFENCNKLKDILNFSSLDQKCRKIGITVLIENIFDFFAIDKIICMCLLSIPLNEKLNLTAYYNIDVELIVRYYYIHLKDNYSFEVDFHSNFNNLFTFVKSANINGGIMMRIKCLDLYEFMSKFYEMYR